MTTPDSTDFEVGVYNFGVQLWINYYNGRIEGLAEGGWPDDKEGQMKVMFEYQDNRDQILKCVSELLVPMRIN